MNTPNESLFTYIYRTKGWGQYSNEKFFSGTGSIPETVLPYIEYTSRYIKDHGIQSVVDLGCGDFRVSSMINLHGARYLGIDVVKDLIAYNQSQFGSEQIQFHYQDIVHDDLKGGDLCLIKQVLQHLSDSDIQSILAKVKCFKHVLILDDYYDKAHPPNEEVKAGGQRHRGTYLELPPFNCEIEPLLIYPDHQQGTFFRLVKLISSR